MGLCCCSGKGKTDCEVLIYEWGAKHGVECMSSCPSVVLGPLLAVPHDMTWQHRLGEMFAGARTPAPLHPLYTHTYSSQ